MKTKKIPFILISRMLVQLIFLFLLPFAVTLTFDGIRAIFVAIIHNDFNFKLLFPKLILLFSVIPASILLGRFFCGWVCTFGALQDFSFFISKKLFKYRHKLNENFDNYLKMIKLVVLGICVVLIWILNIKLLAIISPWDAFGLMPDFKTAITTFTISFIILLGVIIISFFSERFFCRYLCPLGAFFTLVSSFRIFKIKKPTKNCGKCRMCTNNCPMGIPLYKYDVVKSNECIMCMNCTEVCPKNNAKCEVFSQELNPLIASAIAVATIGGTNIGLNILKPKTSNNSYSVQDAGTNNQNKMYKNGVFEGVADGFRPNLHVSVTLKNDKIIGISIGQNNESDGYKEQPFDLIPKRIIDSQSTENIAVVSGATYSSLGVINAVNNALNKALLPKNSTNTTSDINLNTTNTNIEKENSPIQPTNVLSGSFKDGTYTGNATGFEGNISVKVIVSGNKISSVSILSQAESKPLSALTEIPRRIVSSNSTNVSAVSGATYTSNGIINAVNNALVSAINNSTVILTNKPLTTSNSNSPNTTTTPYSGTYKNGTYTGTAIGFEGNISVKVVVSGGKISSVSILSQAESRPKPAPAFIDALIEIPNRIVSANSTNVSVVSGATYTSYGIINAVKSALSNAQTTSGTTSSTPTSSTTPSTTTSTTTSTPNSGTYKDGTYTGSAMGFEGNISVKVVVSGGKISSVSILSQAESRPTSPRTLINALTDIPNRIVLANSTNVSVVSGATYTSNGIINAVKNALSNAQTTSGTTSSTPTSNITSSRHDDDDEWDD